MTQSELFTPGFRTARPAQPLYCHQEFLEKLEANRAQPTGKRAALLLQRLAVDLRRLHYKATYGENRGWRRSRLGGNRGSHFYAWWATKASPPVKDDPSFSEAPEEAVFLRDIRHHDDHTPLSADDFTQQYLPVTIPDLRQEAFAPAPWTTSQARFAKTKGAVRVLKGHPGSGKTTALLNAADQSNASRVLYITFSTDLAALARDHFDRFCSADRAFTVLTFPAFLQQLMGSAAAAMSPAEGLDKFRRDVVPYQRTLGPWSNDVLAMHSEMHAHLVGTAVPETAGRFTKAEKLHLPFADYIRQRSRYLGATAASALVDTAQRLERSETAPLADRYFPQLAQAWRAAQMLSSHKAALNQDFLRFQCIAVDEVQDLTPLESYVVIALARMLGSGAPLLLAGDEAQTVRPTDFEWAWLNDMLHGLLATPQDFKLISNLRSPRGIANLVNRVWDYYGHLEKHDRPSGSGYAEIDDDSPDQILFCTSTAGEELNALLTGLSQREGLAIISFDPTTIPERLRSLVLTPDEVKGLDFHSICVLDAGRVLTRVSDAGRARSSEIEALHRRLGIDRLRVALSRPTERLIWIEVDPPETVLLKAQNFLEVGAGMAIAPITVEGLQKTLEEDELDIEERLQRCQQDARQFVSVKPDLAWSRAQHAVALLGVQGQIAAVSDMATRKAAHLTVTEVCFQLGFRRAKLSPELGHPDLFAESCKAARAAGRHGLAHIIQLIGAACRPGLDAHSRSIASLLQVITLNRKDLEGWLSVEIAPQVDNWIEEVEHHMPVGDNASLAMAILPPFFDAMGLPDAESRRKNLAKRAVDIMLKAKRHGAALEILEKLPERQLKLEAECLEVLGQHARAAAVYQEIGDSDKALRCFRAVPDFTSALALVRKLDTHPARESLEWLGELDAVIARRPEKFNRVMTPPEKKILEAMMERALGVQRKKPALKGVKKAAAKAPAKRAPRKKPLF